MGKETIKVGLIGKSLGHSFSKGFFADYFQQHALSQWSYGNFEMPEDAITDFVKTTDLVGFNITIPYKERILQEMDELSPEVEAIGAMNTAVRLPNGSWKGYNTDIIGIANSLKPFLESQHENALILGTGGAAKAVKYVLESLGVATRYVSRTKVEPHFTYEEVNEHMMQHFKLIVNCTPLGTAPNIQENPSLPYSALTPEHLLFDLIYNPAETRFMQLGKEQGATCINGLTMLHEQALAAFDLWKSAQV